MEEVKAAPAAYAAPAPTTTTPASPGKEEQYIQTTPGWVIVVRGLQVLFALVIICLCGYLIHGKAMDANVFALVVCLMTWVVAAYSLFSEKIPGLHGLYNIWAVLALDLLMAIFWLSSMGANAAQRASFRYAVDVDYCYNDGSTVNSNYCVVSKRDLERRAAVAGPVGLAVMSAIAGLSALMMLLFIATLVFHGHNFRLHHQSKKPSVSDNAGTVEMNPQPTQAAYTQYPQYPQQAQQQAQPQGYPPQEGYQQHPPQSFSPQSQTSPYAQGYPQQYPQTVPSPAPVSTPSPAPQPMYSPPPAAHELPHSQPQQHEQHAGPYQLQGSQPQTFAAYPDPTSQGQYQQQQPHPYSPHGTPAPGMPSYYPPQQQQ